MDHASLRLQRGTDFRSGSENRASLRPSTQDEKEASDHQYVTFEVINATSQCAVRHRQPVKLRKAIANVFMYSWTAENY